MLKAKSSVLRILILPFQELSLGLPLNQVQKVIPTPTIFKGGVPSLGILHFESEEVIVVDLHQKVYGQPNPKPEPYTVLVKTAHHPLYGIPSMSLPLIQDVNQEQVSPLPQEYRDRDPLGIATHTVIVSRDQGMQTVFLLDLNQLLI